jgi:nicotinamidase-related amidase
MSNPKLEVLTPQNSQLIFIDHQPQMAFGVQSVDRAGALRRLRHGR